MSVRLDKLPTLAELRARRAEALGSATRRLVPRLLITSLALVPAVAAAVLVTMGRIDRSLVVPIILAAAMLSMFGTGYVVLDYMRRILPEELTRAGLVCYACGRPLMPAAASRAPGGSAAIEGKCASCGVAVVRDAERQAA